MIDVKLAERKTSLLDLSSPLLKYQVEQTVFQLEFKCTKTEKTAGVLDWAFHLVEQNVKHLYAACDWGWKPKKKISEIQAKWARYLIASINSEPIGFSMFRFDMESGYSVLYCYELQIASKYQGLGLGKHIMKLLEYIALQQSMQKVMLTVFKENKDAYKFYLKLGYEIDEISPKENDNEPYYILSKHINSHK